MPNILQIGQNNLIYSPSYFDQSGFVVNIKFYARYFKIFYHDKRIKHFSLSDQRGWKILKTFHFRIFAQGSHTNTEVNYFFVESIRFAF